MDNVFDFGDIVEKKDFAISNLWNSEMFLVIAFDFEKYHGEAEEIKNIIERYIYVDDEKAFKKCRKKWDEEMIIGIDGVQWIPENVGEIVAFTDEINEVLARTLSSAVLKTICHALPLGRFGSANSCGSQCIL